ncbi:hypothetical protein [Arthrobacter crystallopoietes]
MAQNRYSQAEAMEILNLVSGNHQTT